MRSTDDQSTIRWLPVVGLYCFRGLKIDFNQNLSLCDRCTKSVRVHQQALRTRSCVLRIFSYSQVAVRKPLGSCQVAVRQLLGSCQVAVWQLSGSCQVALNGDCSLHTAAQSQCLLRVPSYKFTWSHVRNYAAQLSLYVARQCWARRTQHRQQQFFGALEKKEILGFLTFQRLIYI